MSDIAAVELIRRLCQELQQLPAAPGTQEAGKLYERVVTLALACRVALAQPGSTMTVSELLYGSDLQAPHLAMLVTIPSIMPELQLPCFPRASGKDSSGQWVNVECPQMPQRNDAWFAVYSEPHALLHDAGLHLPSGGPHRSVNLQLQMKEWQLTRLNEAIGNFQREGAVETHFKWKGTKNTAFRFLDGCDLVRVLVTPNGPEEGFQPLAARILEADVAGQTQRFTVFEALLTHKDVRGWSPMVAYSGCDARVLQM